MIYLICSVYYNAKQIQQKPMKCDLSDTLGGVFHRMEVDSVYYLLPPDYCRVESSGVSISPDGMVRWIPASPEDTVEMCSQLSMKYIRFLVKKVEEEDKPQKSMLTVTEVLMKSSRDMAKRQKEEETRRRLQLPKK